MLHIINLIYNKKLFYKMSMVKNKKINEKYIFDT